MEKTILDAIIAKATQLKRAQVEAQEVPAETQPIIVAIPLPHKEVVGEKKRKKKTGVPARQIHQDRQQAVRSHKEVIQDLQGELQSFRHRQEPLKTKGQAVMDAYLQATHDEQSRRSGELKGVEETLALLKSMPQTDEGDTLIEELQTEAKELREDFHFYIKALGSDKDGQMAPLQAQLGKLNRAITSITSEIQEEQRALQVLDVQPEGHTTQTLGSLIVQATN